MKLTPDEKAYAKFYGAITANKSKASATPEKVRELNPIFGKGLYVPSKHTDAKEMQRMGLAGYTIPAEKPTAWFGAYDSEGKLRATFDSESEAYFYIRNRGHVNGGSYRPIQTHADQRSAVADKLAEALREMALVPVWGKSSPVLAKATQALSAYQGFAVANESEVR